MTASANAPATDAPTAALRSTALPRVTPGAFLTLHYRLVGPDGADVVSTFGLQPATVTLGTGQLVPALEERLVGMAEGDEARFEIPAGEAFGARNPDLVQPVSRELLGRMSTPGTEFAVGDIVEFPTPDGTGTYAGLLRELHDDACVFDFNHPLAGQPVRYDVRIIGVLA